VIFLGNSIELNKILCYSDVFLLPSESESFGLAALEAMAAETPVISTNTGGLPEVNVNGVTGFLSNVGDITDMANNTLNILESEENLALFKKNAKAHTHQFALANILPVYEDIYNSVLKRETV
jgi:glycosyltransferase involved in cell wall biosynthesis